MTQPTVDDLQKDLQKELNQLKIDIAKNKDKTAVTKVQSSQKLRKFSGDTPEVKDWVAEAKRSVS